MKWEGWMAQYRKRGERDWKMKFCESRDEAARFVEEMKAIGCDANF